MLPTLSPGQTVLVSSLPFLFSKPRVGDIVILRYKEQKFIKRIKQIEHDQYFVVGDNHADSHDSRDFGFISRENIVGKVIRKL